jgi:hypothetical protein
MEALERIFGTPTACFLLKNLPYQRNMASFLDVMVVVPSDVGSLIHVLIIILVLSLMVDKSVGALFTLRDDYKRVNLN